jgi:Protein of unknown function (DUF1214)
MDIKTRGTQPLMLEIAVGLALTTPLLAWSGSANAQSSSLATADQQIVEKEAIKIVALPEVREQIEASTQAFKSLPVAQDPEALRSLSSAVGELAFASALDAVDSDPDRPKVVWGFTAPRTWLGYSVPGSRWGIDNPDNVYRIIPVDASSKYRITVHAHGTGPIQFSFLVYDSFVGEDGRVSHLDTPVAGLRDRDIKRNRDGSFDITVDASPANGRANHIQTNANARVLLVRNTFNDWAHQVPFEVSVHRLGTPSHPPLSEKEEAARTARFLKSATETISAWQRSGFAARTASNVISKPNARGGGWGFAANGNFKLANDEALVVTLDPLGASYVGFDLTNPWLVSLDHIHGSGSLNNHQAQPNPDGTISYVIAAQDPGVYNWLSTSGVHAGNILIRWQALPDSVRDADAAVRSVKVVKLSELANALPSTIRHVTALERREQLAERERAYAHRYTTGTEVARLSKAP